ncbi:DUF7482 domain-containing protein [Marinomonas profundimaris]|uniref:DUF7482 domain-containing protein n=1 Tax=Marinomonas profundimaris TaxID=1208321 RepID=W1RYG9_9GAMM|nr:hypothetical protein [Marinomonas profundimaris]ETI60754.1 hypothetical protein D104_08620 [Marinomonas profundimaris]
MLIRSVLCVITALFLVSCSNHSVQKDSTQVESIRLPLLHGWHDGKDVLYITTDVSDQTVAKAKNANYAPRLRDAVPNYPKPPQVKTVLERVYAFPNGEQSKSVFASVPEPLGYLSADRHYSPLWLMYVVVWKDPNKAQELTSEEAIFVAEDQGMVTIERTDIVLNCPVIPFVLGAS